MYYIKMMICTNMICEVTMCKIQKCQMNVTTQHHDPPKQRKCVTASIMHVTQPCQHKSVFWKCTDHTVKEDSHSDREKITGNNDKRPWIRIQYKELQRPKHVSPAAAASVACLYFVFTKLLNTTVIKINKHALLFLQGHAYPLPGTRVWRWKNVTVCIPDINIITPQNFISEVYKQIKVFCLLSWNVLEESIYILSWSLPLSC